MNFLFGRGRGELFLVLGIFLIIVSPQLFAKGMFMDGLIYATIARNMAESIGSFWSPTFTPTLFPEFYEHPPLAIGLQSLFFRVFGDYFWVERLYSLICYFGIATLILLIWKRVTSSFQGGWLPLLLWVLTAQVTWAVSNNMLENTMTLFCLASFHFLTFKNNSLLWTSMAGFLLFLAFLSKGPFALYLWGFPLFQKLTSRGFSWRWCTQKTVIYILSTLVPLSVLVIVVPEAQNNIVSYFTKQVVGGVTSAQTVDYRWAILEMFLQNIVVPGILAVLGFMLFQSKSRTNLAVFKPFALALVLVSFAGIFPIMISLKQRAFYILSVYPFFWMGISLLLWPRMRDVFQNWRIKRNTTILINSAAIVLMTLGVALNFYYKGSVTKHKHLFYDSQQIIEIVGSQQKISTCKANFSNWSLQAYLYRYGKVYLTDIEETTHFIYSSACEIEAPARYKNQFYLKSFTLYEFDL